MSVHDQRAQASTNIDHFYASSSAYVTVSQLNNRERQQIRAANDPILHPLLDAETEPDYQRAIEAVLLLEAKPIIDEVLSRGRWFAADTVDDVASTVSLRLVRRLHRIRFLRADAIHNLHDFVIRVTNNAVYDQLRKEYPLRTRLKNRLRYTLLNDGRFETWLIDGVTVGGLRRWPGRAEPVRHLSISKQQATTEMLDRNDLPRAIEAVMTRVGRPVILDDLIGFFAELWGVVDEPAACLDEQVSSSSPHSELEMREFLANLWKEICALPSRQRVALLSNLRDPQSVSAVALFVLVGTATFAEIAACLEMSPDELTAIWNDLPMDDLAIAGKLGVTRQQVINLRKSARERLSRRMQRKERWPL